MRWLALAVGLMGCGGGAGPPPADGDVDVAAIDAAAVDADPAEICANDVTRWREIVDALSRDCVVDNDCTTAGTPAWPCEGSPSVGGCSGIVVSRSAYLASEASEYESDFLMRGCPCDACGVDCGPLIARCIGGACTGEADPCVCNPPPGTCP